MGDKCENNGVFIGKNLDLEQGSQQCTFALASSNPGHMKVRVMSCNLTFA